MFFVAPSFVLSTKRSRNKNSPNVAVCSRHYKAQISHLPNIHQNKIHYIKTPQVWKSCTHHYKFTSLPQGKLKVSPHTTLNHSPFPTRSPQIPNKTMDHPRNYDLPPNFSETYKKLCRTFAERLDQQVTILSSPQPDRLQVMLEIRDLASLVGQIGYLGWVGGSDIPDRRRVLPKYGYKPLKDICATISGSLDQLAVMLAVDDRNDVVVANELEEILNSLPFEKVAV